MKCPNCGFEQPEAQECVKCGIVFKKHLQRLDLIQDPASAITKIVASYAAQINDKTIYFAPRIPEDLLCRDWLKCAGWGVVDPEEQALMLGHERMPLGGRPDALIVTTRGMVISSSALLTPAGLDYANIREIGLGGLFADKLTIDGQPFSLRFLVALQGSQGKLLEKMLREILNVARSASRNGSWTPRAAVILDEDGAPPEGFALRQVGKAPILIADAVLLATGEMERIGADLKPPATGPAQPAVAQSRPARPLPGAAHAANALVRESGGQLQSGAEPRPPMQTGAQTDVQAGVWAGRQIGAEALPVQTPTPIIVERDSSSKVTWGWKFLAHAVGLFVCIFPWAFLKGILPHWLKVSPQAANYIGMAIAFFTWQGIAREIIRAVTDWKRRRAE